MNDQTSENDHSGDLPISFQGTNNIGAGTADNSVALQLPNLFADLAPGVYVGMSPSSSGTAPSDGTAAAGLLLSERAHQVLLPQQQQYQRYLQQFQFQGEHLSPQPTLASTSAVLGGISGLGLSAANPMAINAALLLGSLNTHPPTANPTISLNRPSVDATTSHLTVNDLLRNPVVPGAAAVASSTNQADYINRQALAALGAYFSNIFSAGQPRQAGMDGRIGNIGLSNTRRTAPIPLAGLHPGQLQMLNLSVDPTTSLLPVDSPEANHRKLQEIIGTLSQYSAAAANHQSVIACNSKTNAAVSAPENVANSNKSCGKLPTIIYMDCDDESLSQYQCVLRKQIELFEATGEDVQWNAQGRNKAVGLRCRHCASLPSWSRARGAVYYSATLDGLYQAAQNMAKNHLCRHCRLIPGDDKKQLMSLRDCKRRAAGGKKYWAEGARVLGVIQTTDGLCFRPYS